MKKGVTVIFTCLVLMFSVSFVFAAVPSAIAGYGFENNPNAAIGNLNGFEKGEITYNSNGYYGSKAVGFDGTSSIIIDDGTAFAFQPDNAFSISLWSFFTGNSDGALISKRGSNAEGLEIRKTSANRIMVIIDGRESNSGTGNRIVTYSDAAIESSTFQNIVVTYDGSKALEGVRIYVDAIDVTNSSKGTGGLENSTILVYPSNTTVGNSQFSDGMVGAMDELKIWNVALTPQQVLSHAGVIAACEDSDGGKEYGTFGRASGFYKGTYVTRTDLCRNDGTNRLNEVFCNSSGDLDIEFGVSCADGETCMNGACATQMSCVDTDGGIDYGVYGEADGVWLNSQGSPEVRHFYDMCLRDNSNRLNEAYCNATSGYLEIDRFHKCADEGKVCYNGICTTANLVGTVIGTTTEIQGLTITIISSSATETEQSATINVTAISRVFTLNNNTNPTQSAIVNGKDYQIRLASASDTSAVIEVTEAMDSVCSDFITRIQSPTDFRSEGIYFVLEENGEGRDSKLINGEDKSYNYYQATWKGTNADYSSNGQIILQEIDTFDDSAIEGMDILEGLLESPACSIINLDSEEESIVTCNFQIFENKVGISERQIYWANNNVLVTIKVFYGEELTVSEIRGLDEENLFKFLDKLQGNNDYATGSYEDIPSILFNQVMISLGECSSDIEYDPERCQASLECKTEPAICPPHGKQTRTCRDISLCELPDSTTIMDCTPGMCSGCMIPEGYELNEGTCIPYGIRLKNTAEEPISRYCALDGTLKDQMKVADDGTVPSCENNYECKSNVCSNGECKEISQVVGETAGFRAVFVKVICKLAHLFDVSNYNECVIEALGEEALQEVQGNGNSGPPSMASLK
jgi:hypothetical protein